MSSLLWAAAAATAAAAPATSPTAAEELIERARSFYSLDLERERAACPEASGDEIVVCREIGDPERYRVPTPTDQGRTEDGLPRAPNVSGLPDCASATVCSRMGGKPRQVILIDLNAIPEAPPGSDADRIAKGEMAAP